MQKIIVSGPMRSGTTFMANFLNSQDDIVCYADFFGPVVVDFEKMEIKSMNTPLTDTQKNVFLSSLRAVMMSLGFDFAKDISGDDFNTTKELLDVLFESLRNFDSYQANTVGVKITEHHDTLSPLTKEGYKMIYLIRDPRDIMWSSKNRFSSFNLNLRLLDLSNIFEFLDTQKDNQNILVVRYEDLMNQDKETIKQVEDFLGTNLNFDINLLKYRNNVTYNDNSSFGDVKKLFDTKGINRWKENKKEPAVVATNTILKDAIRNFGYEDLDVTDGRYIRSFKRFKLKNTLKNQFKKWYK